MRIAALVLIGLMFAVPSVYAQEGHQAGHDWAEEHDIEDPDDCGGNSDSFIEGCQEYAEERQEEIEQEEEDEAGDEDEY